MVEDPQTRRPPRGYMPFLVEHRSHRGWVVATPFCDAADEIVAEVQDPDPETWEGIDVLEWEGDVHQERHRVLGVFDTREGAVEAAWAHAGRWWGGEPPDAPSIPTYEGLPADYAIFVEASQRRIWLSYPDGSCTGEISGVCLSSGIQMYADQAEAHRRAAAGLLPPGHVLRDDGEDCETWRRYKVLRPDGSDAYHHADPTMAATYAWLFYERGRQRAQAEG